MHPQPPDTAVWFGLVWAGIYNPCSSCSIHFFATYPCNPSPRIHSFVDNMLGVLDQQKQLDPTANYRWVGGG